MKAKLMTAILFPHVRITLALILHLLIALHLYPVSGDRNEQITPQQMIPFHVFGSSHQLHQVHQLKTDLPFCNATLEKPCE